MQSVLEAARRWRQDYLNRAGLGKLEATVEHNDNGILFAMYGYYILNDLGLINATDRDRFDMSRRMLQVQPGLYNRSIHPSQFLEAHDNYVGWVAGAVLFDKEDIIRSIIDYGERKGWNYNNMEPGVWKLEAQRQPSEAAFYKICAGDCPGFVEMLWLCIGLAFFGKGLLSWLRVKAMKLALKKSSCLPGLYTLALNLAMLAWGARANSIKQMIHAYYQDKSHPIHEMVEAL